MKRLKALFFGKSRHRGTTLVETIVAFALTIIFMAAAGNALMSFMSVYAKVDSMIAQQNIGASLMELAADTLANCSKNPTAGEDSIVISEAASHADIVSGNGQRVSLFVNEQGLLELKYQQDPEEGGNIEWYLGEGFYMDNIVSSLSFEKRGESMIMVTMTLRNAKNGSQYSLYKLVDCATNRIRVE